MWLEIRLWICRWHGKGEDRKGELEKACINTVILLSENRWDKCMGDSWV